MGLSESVAEYFPDADWQRCTVHFYRDLFSHVPRAKMAPVSAMLKAIDAQESREAAQEKAVRVVEELHTVRLQKAAVMVERCIGKIFAFYHCCPVKS